MAFVVGDVVAGRYEVLASVGQRPLGWLYRAREREIGVEVALRVIGADLLSDEPMRVGFIQKVGRARAFSHPNLVRVFGVYPTPDEVVIAAQWAPGQTLHDRILARTFTADEARPLVAQVAAGLTHAHQHGVVLADVHAATVVLLGQTLKVSNVGIGPSLPRKRFLEAVRDTTGYQRLPPELRSGMTVDTRADVYSLAMLVVEMLTGGADRTAVMGPEPLKTVLGRALADDPMVRHTSIDALAHELDAGLSGLSPKPRRMTPPIGVPIAREPSGPNRSPDRFDRVEDATGPVPRPEEVRPPSQETTRAIDPEELELLRGDQITRQLSQEEIFPLRVASSETQQFELEEMIVEEAAPTPGEELRLEAVAARPPEDDSKTDQVVLLEPDAAKTTEHPRLPPSVNEDEIDTSRVTRADVQDLIDHDDSNDPNATPLPPPMPAGSAPPPPTPLTSLADSRDAPTKVEVREPNIEISVELPIIEVVPAPDKPADAAADAPTAAADEPLYGRDDDEDAPTRTAGPAVPLPPSAPPAKKPLAAKPSPARPSPTSPAPKSSSKPSPTLPAQASSSEPGSDNASAPAPSSGPAATTTEAAPPAGAPGVANPRRKRRNPFDPSPPDEDARTTEHKSPPARRNNPFTPASASAPAPAADRDVGARTVDDRRKKSKPRATVLVNPIGERRGGRGPILLVAVAAFIAAVGVALAFSHYLQQERLEQERRDKQRLADELNAHAEALRRQQADAGVAPTVSTPLVTHPEPTPTVLPRAGACPLGAHLVSGPGHAFCVDVYEYPGGNTIPRTQISFAEAARICAARGERLCSEGEWERACRGKGSASYPYGQAFDATRCNTKGTGGEVAPTGTFAGCKSAVGAYDMSGNVAEWVASGAQKGGAATQGGKESRCSAVARNLPQSGGALVGFRCCAEPTAKH